jgi:hypothetical protein
LGWDATRANRGSTRFCGFLEGPLRGNDGLLLFCSRYQEIILDGSGIFYELYEKTC